MTPLGKIRRAVCERAEGSCEACGAHVGMDGELAALDHFWGRKLAVESVETTWLLCNLSCNPDKTVNHPSQRHWLIRWQLHCFEYGLIEQAHRAAIRLGVLEQKFGASP